MIKRTHLALVTLKMLHYKKELSVEFENYSEILTRDTAMQDKYPEEEKIARQKVEVLLGGIKTANTKLIACNSIISNNYANYFTGVC